jgi:predicted transcriptional regulator
MLKPEEVSAMLRLNELGWAAKRIARELGVSRNTVKDYVVAGGLEPEAVRRRPHVHEQGLSQRFRFGWAFCSAQRFLCLV